MMTIAQDGTPFRWIIELDYDADPDVDSAALKRDIVDHLAGTREPAYLKGTRIFFSHGDDALSARLRYGENVTRVVTEIIE